MTLNTEEDERPLIPGNDVAPPHPLPPPHSEIPMNEIVAITGDQIDGSAREAGGGGGGGGSVQYLHVGETYEGRTERTRCPRRTMWLACALVIILLTLAALLTMMVWYSHEDTKNTTHNPVIPEHNEFLLSMQLIDDGGNNLTTIYTDLEQEFRLVGRGAMVIGGSFHHLQLTILRNLTVACLFRYNQSFPHLAYYVEESFLESANMTHYEVLFAGYRVYGDSIKYGANLVNDSLFLSTASFNGRPGIYTTTPRSLPRSVTVPGTTPTPASASKAVPEPHVMITRGKPTTIAAPTLMKTETTINDDNDAAATSPLHSIITTTPQQTSRTTKSVGGKKISKRPKASPSTTPKYGVMLTNNQIGLMVTKQTLNLPKLKGY